MHERNRSMQFDTPAVSSRVERAEQAIVPFLFRRRMVGWLWLVAVLFAGSGLLLWVVAWWR